MAIWIISRRSSDQVQNLHLSMRHTLNHVVELSLAGGDTLQMELGLGLHELCLNVVRSEWRQLHSDSVQEICSG